MAPRPPPVDGTCDERFIEVKNSFSRNFTEGWEKEGASFAVFYRGKLIIDLWGGWADRSCRRPWREDTLTTIFSCTKSLASICVAMLVDRGLCDYSDKVTKYWPEFGCNGKEDITILMVLQHQAGLPYFRKKLQLTDLTNLVKMSSLIEEAKPLWTPGSRSAYHPLTFGWIIDQIFCRIDRDGRTVGQFFREEISTKHRKLFGRCTYTETHISKYHKVKDHVSYLDIHIGDCAPEENRVARITWLNRALCLREFSVDRKIATIAAYYYNPKGNFVKAEKNMNNFGNNFSLYNNAELRISGQPAVNGISTARALAQAHQLILDGSILSPYMVERLSTPVLVDQHDETVGEKLSKGHGFMYTRSPKGNWQQGHMGVGGQMVRMDRDNQLVFAYLTNGMKAGTGEHVFTYNRLQKKVYEIIEKLEKK